MKTHENCRKAFTHTGASWYAKSVLEALKESRITDEVFFGWYPIEGGGCVSEMSMKWRKFDGREASVPMLTVFDDAFSALSDFKDVIDELANHDNQKMNAAQFCDILTRCGFVNRTENTAPVSK